MHTGEMGGTARCRDDDLDAGPSRISGKGEGVIRGSMGREDPHLDGNAEGAESLDGVVHDGRVG